MKKKLAIIGASYLQLPLIEKARKRGIETHVFAWQTGDVGEREADYFYPFSITEKSKILEKCQEIKIDGICSIASDLAIITVNYVAYKMGLIGNTLLSTEVSTNKFKMRQCFAAHGDPSPKSIQIKKVQDLKDEELKFPLIVKPVDRSGSRGITKLENEHALNEAIENARNESFQKNVLVEEFVMGQEYSVEYISWKGEHTFIALTRKYTTGSPSFIETAHTEPAYIEGKKLEKIKKVVSKALTSLGIEYGASHTEIKISNQDEIKIIEVGGRMGGDCIGSSLVEFSTGFDFVNAVIDIAFGIKPKIQIKQRKQAAVRFIFSNDDLIILDKIKKEHPEILVAEDIWSLCEGEVIDSGSRFGYYIFASEDPNKILRYLSDLVN